MNNHKEMNLPVFEKKVDNVKVQEEIPVVKEEPKILNTSTKSLDRIREIKEKKKNKFSASVIEPIVENKDSEIDKPVEAKETDDTLDDKKEEQNYESL
jgi:hypothetical protein